MSTPHEHPAPGSHKGFIAFCETNLRYEKGFKAWIILGPYLLGAVVLEEIATAFGHTLETKFALWGSLLVYLVLFPEIWRRILRRRHSFKPLAKLEATPTAP